MKMAAAIGDFVICYCAGATGACAPGMILTGSLKTIVTNRPLARVGDMCSNCCIGLCKCPNMIITGSPKTIVDNRPAAHIGSTVVCGMVTTGSLKLMV